jgi:hypothetical protein
MPLITLITSKEYARTECTGNASLRMVFRAAKGHTLPGLVDSVPKEGGARLRVQYCVMNMFGWAISINFDTPGMLGA